MLVAFIAPESFQPSTDDTVYILETSKRVVMTTSPPEHASPVVIDMGMYGAVRALPHISSDDPIPPVGPLTSDGDDMIPDQDATQHLLVTKTRLQIATADVLDRRRFAWRYSISPNDVDTRRRVEYRLMFNDAPCVEMETETSDEIQNAMPDVGVAICSDEALSGFGPNWFVRGLFLDMIELNILNMDDKMVHVGSQVTVCFHPDIYVQQVDISRGVDAINEIMAGFIEARVYPSDTPTPVVQEHELFSMANGQWVSAFSEYGIVDVSTRTFTFDTPIQLYWFLQWIDDNPDNKRIRRGLDIYVGETIRIYFRTRYLRDVALIDSLRHIHAEGNAKIILTSVDYEGQEVVEFFDMASRFPALVVKL